MRKIVTTNDAQGKACVAIDTTVPVTWCEDIWGTDGQTVLGTEPADAPTGLTPPPGGTSFRMFTLPPESEIRAAMKDNLTPEVDDDGFHCTDTIDYVYILDGPVDLVLDTETVTVQPGDAVVQRGTNHAWRNHGTSPIRMLVVMVSTQRPSS